MLPGGLAGSASLPGAAFGEAPETSLACFASAGYLRDRLGLFSGPPECCFPNSSCQSLSLLPAGLRGAVRGGVPAPPGWGAELAPGSLLGFATSLPPPLLPSSLQLAQPGCLRVPCASLGPPSTAAAHRGPCPVLGQVAVAARRYPWQLGDSAGEPPRSCSPG